MLYCTVLLILIILINYINDINLCISVKRKIIGFYRKVAKLQPFSW